MARELQQAGWVRARALTGGWQAWLDAGLPVMPRSDDSDHSIKLAVSEPARQSTGETPDDGTPA